MILLLNKIIVNPKTQTPFEIRETEGQTKDPNLVLNKREGVS
jgi:hypothetical protein